MINFNVIMMDKLFRTERPTKKNTIFLIIEFDLILNQIETGRSIASWFWSDSVEAHWEYWFRVDIHSGSWQPQDICKYVLMLP